MGKRYLPFLIYFSLIFYLLINTPWISDEFYWIFAAKNSKFSDLLLPASWLRKDIAGSWFIIGPIENYLLFIWCRFFDIFRVSLPNLIKIFYACLSFVLIKKFFSLFLNRQNAFFTAFLFLFFPSHDTTVFAYEGLYSSLTVAFYLYAFYLAYTNKLYRAFAMALISSFTSYASVPMSALSVFFFLKKEPKKGFAVLAPNLIFVFYYVFLTRFLHLTISQIPQTINLYAMLKQFCLQVISFIDAMAGPSMWLKIYYAFPQLKGTSILAGILMLFVLFKFLRKADARINLKLLVSLMSVVVLSFVLFAVTGRYPQLTFNLGNRVTIFGSLLLAYIIILVLKFRMARFFVFFLFIFTVLGISDHWKGWNLHQQKVLASIRGNHDLKNYNDGGAIYVSGNQYSKYGPLSHIEFFSENWAPRYALTLALGRNIPASTINKRHKYKDGYLVDHKYGKKTKVDGFINIYDSEKDILFKLDAARINSFIEALPVDNRHWIQIYNQKFFKKLILKLMPRLNYAL